jgi:hypothetical protein
MLGPLAEPACVYIHMQMHGRLVPSSNMQNTRHYTAAGPMASWVAHRWNELGSRGLLRGRTAVS